MVIYLKVITSVLLEIKFKIDARTSCLCRYKFEEWYQKDIKKRRLSIEDKEDKDDDKKKDGHNDKDAKVGNNKADSSNKESESSLLQQQKSKMT